MYWRLAVSHSDGNEYALEYTRKEIRRNRLIALGIGIVGVFIGLTLWHLYTDHVAFHTIVNLINANAAQVQQAPQAPK